MPELLINCLVELIAQTIGDANMGMAQSFFYQVANDEVIEEGDYALPLRTNDLWRTFLRVMDMTQEEFDQMTFEQIDNDLLRYAY